MKFLPLRLVAIMSMFLTIGLISTSVFASPAYITDKITVDIFSEKTIQGDRIKSLPSGTRLEVLARENDYAKVRTRDNVEGWIESKYLTNEKPTQIEYLQLAVKHKEAQAKIEQLIAQYTGESQADILATMKAHPDMTVAEFLQKLGG